jgi:hypothetical protein
VDTNLLTRLQNWQLINCDGDWEHGYGVSIETLDNPGWRVKINLVDTCLENLDYEKQFENGTFDWLFIKINEKVFEASGDTNKLTTILEIFFKEIIPKHSDPSFQYEVFVQLFGGPTKIWRPVKAKLVAEDTLQITEIPELTYRDIRTMDYDDLTFQQDDIFKYKTKIQVGDNIKVELIETFNGVTLIAKE